MTQKLTRLCTIVCLTALMHLGIRGGLIAQDGALEFTLEEAIMHGLKHGKTIQNARFDEYIAQARVKEIVASGYPQLNATADLQYFVELPTSILPAEFNIQQEIEIINGKPYPLTKLDPETMQPVLGEPIEVQFGFPWQSTAGFQLNQLVFDGVFFIGLEASRTFVDLAKLGSNRTQEEVAYGISKAYYQAMIAEERLNLLDANIARVKKLFEETQALNKEGFAEKIDVDRLQLSFNNLELEKAKLVRFVDMSKNLLKFQMALPIENQIILTENKKTMIREPEIGNSRGMGERFDPSSKVEYSILKTQYELEQYNLKRFRAGYFPSLYAFGSYQWNAQRTEFNFFQANQGWFPISVVGLQLNVPIFDGFRKHNQIQQSRLAMKKIENQISIFNTSSQLEFINAENELINAYQNLESYKKNVDLATKVFKVSQIKYKEGVGSSLEVNEAESQLKQAESNYLGGLFSYLMAKVELKKVQGGYSEYHTNE